jgi:hypothetical protein
MGHPLDKCEVFRKLILERRLAKLKKTNLCLYCFLLKVAD